MPVSASTNTNGAYRQYNYDVPWVGAGVPGRTTTFKEWGVKYGQSGDGSNPTSYYRRIQKVLTDVTAKYKAGNGPYDFQVPLSWDVSYPYINPPDVYSGPIDNALSQVTTEALNKLRDGKVQNGADLGEARRTAQMIGSNVTQVANAIRAAKRGDWGAIPQLLRMNPRDVLTGRYPANKWLEYQYGWKPLLTSIYDNASLIGQSINGERPLRMKAVRTITGKGPTLRNDPYFYHTYQWDCDWRVQCGLYAHVTCPALVNADLFGMANPLSIAWELTPLSFVVDWFIPVGNVLDALSATAGLSSDGGWRSYTKECTLRYSLNPKAVNWQVYDVGDCLYKDFLFSRQALGGFPMPQLYGKTNPFSTPHITSALALIRQRF